MLKWQTINKNSLSFLRAKEKGGVMKMKERRDKRNNFNCFSCNNCGFANISRNNNKFSI